MTWSLEVTATSRMSSPSLVVCELSTSCLVRRRHQHQTMCMLDRFPDSYVGIFELAAC